MISAQIFSCILLVFSISITVRDISAFGVHIPPHGRILSLCRARGRIRALKQADLLSAACLLYTSDAADE